MDLGSSCEEAPRGKVIEKCPRSHEPKSKSRGYAHLHWTLLSCQGIERKTNDMDTYKRIESVFSDIGVYTTAGARRLHCAPRSSFSKGVSRSNECKAIESWADLFFPIRTASSAMHPYHSGDSDEIPIMPDRATEVRGSQICLSLTMQGSVGEFL
ncbi:hypothetical protein PAXRUDRAFT_634591 [Paxillus rubicundulus Ve08.2h10]|uniref:Uncharacterized protein n=1 Tax=Paxillus rubicundulus Ve08.2h10 TaxID=930991 RepID=A0A0D0DSU9_9AGAM|nr:hypothetical protein PAXRUDRAFT_634591 [Paxillus rubicundulus Ve08.2h10]